MQLFELQSDFVKNLIHDTIETYSGQWRMVHEAVQNAHDAIQIDESSSKGQIEVRLHLGRNYVEIRDSGKGIPIEEATTLFSLGGTAKSPNELRKLVKGSQGVGIKATVYTSEFFEVESECTTSHWGMRLENCYRFAETDFDGEIEGPHEVDKSNTTFTVVKYRLADYSVREFLEEIIAGYMEEFFEPEEPQELVNVEQLQHLLELYFRTQTYLGCVQQLLGTNSKLKPIQVKVKVLLDAPTVEAHTSSEIKGCSFLAGESYFESQVCADFSASYFDYKEWHSALGGNKADNVFETMAKVIETPPQKETTKILIQKIDPSQARWLLHDVKKDKDTGKNEFVANIARQEKHHKLLEKLNGIYLVIGTRNYKRKFLHLTAKHIVSVNGSPTNVALNAPKRGGELGYLLNTHIVIDLDTTMGYGKRNIPPVVKGQVDAYFADIFPMIRKAAKNLVGRGTPEKAADSRIWKRDVLFQEYESGGNFMRGGPLNYGMVPQEEQDLICIFHQLVASGHLKGYSPLRTSGIQVYDSVMFIDEKTDAARSWVDIRTVEFKLRLADLVEDFITQTKFIDEVDLAIVWEIDYSGDEYFVSDMARDGKEGFPGAVMQIRCGNLSCQILELKSIVKAIQEGAVG